MEERSRENRCVGRDAGGRLCRKGLWYPGQCPLTRQGAPKPNPRPLACFNKFPGHEEGRWGKAHKPSRRGCPAGRERLDLELLRRVWWSSEAELPENRHL